MGGRAVKVGRPSNMGQAEHFITQFAQEAARYNRYGLGIERFPAQG